MGSSPPAAPLALPADPSIRSFCVIRLDSCRGPNKDKRQPATLNLIRSMKTVLISSCSVLLLAASALTSQAQLSLIWACGLDENGWPMGDGGGPNTSFVQENGSINPLPGSSFSTEVPRGADNDYYFAGSYTMTIPSVIALYGDYTPVGDVPVNEEAAERAFAASDLDLRYHFNLPDTLQPTDLVSVTFDANNLDTGEPTRPVPDPRFGVEVYFNGVLVQPEILIRPAQL